MKRTMSVLLVLAAATASPACRRARRTEAQPAQPGAAQVPGQVQGMQALPSQMPGQMPTAMPGQMPTAMPGQMPTAMPAQMPGAMPTPPQQPQIAAPGTAAGGMLPVPGVASGALQAGDTVLNDGSLGDDYNLMLTAGQPVTIVVRGGPAIGEEGTLDVYALILQNGVELIHDDDSAGNLNARIVFTPPASGMYTLRVTTFGSGMHQGSYTVQTLPGMVPNAQ